MVIWLIVVLLIVILQIIMDVVMILGGTFLTIEFRTYFDLAFLFAVLGMLYRVYKMQKRGEKEKLKERIKELEKKIEELQGK
ncbi:MAG: hypothetical protein ABIM49_05225 [candidate division WOR-3 bacterium]